MSLINQMLKDLEDRRGGDDKVRHELLTRRHHSAWPWLLVGILATATAVLGFLLLQKSPVVASTEASTPPSIAAGTTPTTTLASGPATPTITKPEAQAGTAAAPKQAAPEQRVPAIEVQNQAVPSTTQARGEPSRQPVVEQQPVAETEVHEEEGSFSIAPTRLSPIDQAKANFERGYVAMQRKDYRSATNEFVTGLDVIPEDDEARVALYLALRRQGRVAEAEGVLENGLVEAREPHRFATLLARMYTARGQVEEATRILGISPPTVERDPEYFVLWGALLQQLGQYEEALPIYADLVAEDPANGQWIAGLGIAQQQTGDTEAAIENYRQALDIGGLAPAVESYISGQLEQLAPEED